MVELEKTRILQDFIFCFDYQDYEEIYFIWSFYLDIWYLILQSQSLIVHVFCCEVQLPPDTVR